MNHELAKTLTTALVQFIDKERPEGTMCCSNEECESLEYHLRSNLFGSVGAFIQKKLSSPTEFKDKLASFAVQCDGDFDVARKEAAKWSKELLAIAKKELFRQGEGTYYYSPNNDELTYIDSMPMRMPYAVPEKHTLEPLCYEPGGTCTNPHFDCINCPKKTTGGIFTKSNTTTPCGTYTIGYEPVNNH